MNRLKDLITEDIKGLIFDLDGTLADTIPLHLEAWQSAANALGFEVSNEMIMKHSGTPTVIVAQKLGELNNWGVRPEEVAEAKMGFYAEIKAKTGKVKPIQPLLDIVHQYHKVLPLGIGTGSTRKGAMKSLSDINAIQYFDIIVTASDVQNPKPHPETFTKCSGHFGLRPEQCIVFEDGASGIKAAIDGGFRLINVNEYI